MLSAGAGLPKKNKLYQLEPSLDDDGVMRIGGRLRHADVTVSSKQILLPRDHHVTTLIVRHVHHVVCLHSGAEYVLSMIRREYWIPRARTLIRRLIRGCKTCIRLHGRPMAPKMADLPPERLAKDQRAFSYTGIDCLVRFLLNGAGRM